jgi:hypothetical protein
MLRRVTILEDHDDACFELSYDHDIDFRVLLCIEAPRRRNNPHSDTLGPCFFSLILQRSSKYQVLC